jgi:hypothetical protein
MDGNGPVFYKPAFFILALMSGFAKCRAELKKYSSNPTVKKQLDFRELKKPTVGFEPTTTGLQNQSSTIELRWRKRLP